MIRPTISVGFMGVCPGTNEIAKVKFPKGTIIVIANQRILALPYFRMRIINILYTMLKSRYKFAKTIASGMQLSGLSPTMKITKKEKLHHFKF